MYFAGIDWADDHHDVVILAASGERVHQFRVPHSGTGLQQLSEILCSFAPASEVACILETRHGLLVHHLLESGFAVYPVNPKTVDRRRSSARAKTDAIDAALFARYGL